MRFLGFNLGQYGDLAMSTVAARSLKEIYPNSHLTYHIADKYKDFAPLVVRNMYVDAVHISEGYGDYPTENDKKFLLENSFDHIFDPMPQHSRPDWYHYCSTQTEEVCYMHHLKPSSNLQCHLERFFDISRQKGTVAVSLFGNYGQSNKAFSKNKAQEIVDYLIKLGYRVRVIGSPLDPKLKNVIWENLNYFDSVKKMLGCDFLITCDTGMNWVASAYSHPVIGFYFRGALYHDQENFAAIQPVNPNAQYINSYESLNQLDISIISEYIKNI